VRPGCRVRWRTPAAGTARRAEPPSPAERIAFRLVNARARAVAPTMTAPSRSVAAQVRREHHGREPQLGGCLVFRIRRWLVLGGTMVASSPIAPGSVSRCYQTDSSHYLSVTTISVRLFCARPAAVSFEAMGCS
jgi:hypothetical protein